MRTERREKQVNILEDIPGQGYPLTSLNEDGEEGSTARADEDYEDGSDPQVEVGVRTTAGPAVYLSSWIKHGVDSEREGGRVESSGDIKPFCQRTQGDREGCRHHPRLRRFPQPDPARPCRSAVHSQLFDYRPRLHGRTTTVGAKTTL